MRPLSRFFEMEHLMAGTLADRSVIVFPHIVSGVQWTRYLRGVPGAERRLYTRYGDSVARELLAIPGVQVEMNLNRQRLVVTFLTDDETERERVRRVLMKFGGAIDRSGRHELTVANEGAGSRLRL